MGADQIRVATFNASLNRSTEGELADSLLDGTDAQARAIAEILQKTDADIVLLNEFDFDANGDAARLFQENYLSVAQNGADPVHYGYSYVAPSNTGILSGFDLDNNGVVATEADSGTATFAGDSQGFGAFPGQYGFVIFSKYPIDVENVRTFQNFLWKDMPGNLLTEGDTPLTDFYSAEEIEVLRLSSKNHVDVPVIVDGETVHVLAAHPTPPVFDGDEDRNGKHNHDEIRFWSDYVNGADYIYDDHGGTGGLDGGARFVILGDYNADPFDGDSFDGAINQLLDNGAIIGSATDALVTPDGEGGAEQAVAQGGVNAGHIGNPAFDTGDFGFNSADPASDIAPGNLRVDYVLPSKEGFAYLDGAVFWPESTDPDFALTSFPTSDHRLVSVDLAITDDDRVTVEGVTPLGATEIASLTDFEGTTLGGLSGIVYDPLAGTYLAVSDDRDAPRFYEIGIDLGDGALDDGDVAVLDVTELTTSNGASFAALYPDLESIEIGTSGELYISSERDILGDPAIYTVTPDGVVTGDLSVDVKFLANPNGESGVRSNLGFESLTITPDRRTLYTATESALYQDGGIASLENGAAARLVKYDLETGLPTAEYVYEVDPITNAPDPEDAFADAGLVDLVALDNQGTLLALERSYSTGAEGRGYSGKLFLVHTQGATNVVDTDAIPSVEDDGSIELNVDAPVQKELLFDLDDLGIVIDNVEGLALGPVLEDGRQSLVIVSDDNFSGFGPQESQFITLALDLGEVPTIAPVLETPDELRYDSAFDGTEAADPDDPAIWLDPEDAAGSVVVTAMKNGGLRVYDLAGKEIQRIEPDGIRYNNVDILYGVQSAAGETFDLVVASDRENDTLAIYAIGADGTLTEATSAGIPATIFGVDDGEATAYGLAAWKDPDTGKAYAFVTQADGATIAQLEIRSTSDGFTFEKVRALELPVPEGEDPADYQSEGIAIDQETGVGYVTVEDELGLLSFDAHADAPSAFETVAAIDSGHFEPDLEGVAIHYGPDGSGLLIVSSQGDSTFAVFDRGSHDFLGSFAIRPEGDVDGVEESDGLEIYSGNLPGFEQGLLVTQDGSNERQAVWGDPEDGEIQNFNVNFKYSDLEDILMKFGAQANPDYDPRTIGGQVGSTPTDLRFALAAQLDSGSGEGGSEVVSVYDGRAYVTNGAEDRIDVFDIACGKAVCSIDLSDLPGYGGVNSVSASKNGIAVAVETVNTEIASGPMLVGENGWTTAPVFTVGATLGNGYTPVGVLDGIGATRIDEDTVRIYVNHELGSDAGESYEVDGIELTGARISYFDIDRQTLSITDGGIAIEHIVDAAGNVATDTSFTFEDKPGFERFCSGALFEAGQFEGRGLVDRIYMAGEETGGAFSGVGGSTWALDTATGTMYALPSLGRGAWENVTQVDTGTESHVAFIMGDDTSPFDADGDGVSEAAPMFLYVGEKSTDPDAGFLARNGLEGGSIYVFVPDDASKIDPESYSVGDPALPGTWVALDNTPDPALADESGANGYDEFGYPTQKNLWTQAEAAGAFRFSRPEDVSTNPEDGSEIVLASTGVPEDFNGADNAGEVYTMKIDFSALASTGAIGGTLDSIYDGDSDPDQTLRSPDNLDWADDGKIYVQEDRAGDDLFGDGAINPDDAGVVRLDPLTGDAVRIANIDQSAISPVGAVDENVADSGAIDVGDWESSGILDVSGLFGHAGGSLFLADVQAHSLDDQERFDPEGPGGLLTDDALVEGGQLTFLAAPGTAILVEDPVDPEYARNGLVALYNLDGSLKETFEVGNLPDMVTFSKNGSRIFVANEGEAQDLQDPAGSISIINVKNGKVGTYGFEAFDARVDELREAGVRIFPDQLPSTDFEPEYIAEGRKGKLYVTLQEANAVAVFDQKEKAFTDIIALGAADHSIEGFGLDASDRDGAINIAALPVYGLHMPDAIATAVIGGEGYFLTANEGDDRGENVRVEDIDLDPTAFPNAAELQDEAVLGRLNVSSIDGDTDGDGDYDALYAYGSRSFTIFDETGKLVFSSGDEFEQVIARERVPNAFNNDAFPSDDPDVVDDGRSDNKGPEPEAIAIGEIDGDTFAFIGLERDSGVMIYNISDPENSEFVDYIDGYAAGDVGPEVIKFISADESTSGEAQIAISYEISGTTAVYNLSVDGSAAPLI